MEGFDSRLASARSILWVSVLLFLWGQVLPWKTVHLSPDREVPTWSMWQGVGTMLQDLATGAVHGALPKLSEVILGLLLIGAVGLLLSTPMLAQTFAKNRPLQVLSALLSLMILGVLLLVTARPSTAVTMGPGFWLITAAYAVNLLGLIILPHWKAVRR